VKFLIDECLSPRLATVARERGYPQSTHVTWLGLRAQQDWALVRRAVADGYVLVTNDKADFTALMEREHGHPGLVCITIAHGLNRLDVQTRLFQHALTRLADEDIDGRVLEIALRADRTVRSDIYTQI
jgi:predicted nuclease of predicted toxin-antitoxin system